MTLSRMLINQSINQFINQLIILGTNIKDSIKRGIELLQANERPVLSSYLIFLTDGQPTVGEIRVDAILSSIRSINPANKFIIHSIGFGNDVDFNLLKKISIQNSGVPRKVYEDLDTIEQLTGFFQEVSSPLLANVSISYLDESAVDIIQPSSHLYYRGGEMLVVGRLSNANQNVFKAEITATSNNGPERFGIETVFRRIPFPVPDFSIATTTERVPLPAQSLGGFVERMWAYSTIKILLEMATTDPLSQADVEASRQKALHLSLKVFDEIQFDNSVS